MITLRIVVATAIITVIGRLLWKGLDSLLGTSLIAQLLSVGIALSVASAVYAKLVLAMRIPEARQIETLILGRLRGRVAS
jgi:predicted Kef-type K+ transport protein